MLKRWYIKIFTHLYLILLCDLILYNNNIRMIPSIEKQLIMFYRKIVFTINVFIICFLKILICFIKYE